jgi:acetylcholinesterase
MVTNGGNTEGLFHGAFMESGAVIPMGDISLGQHDYDDLVRETGCDGAEDTLECLRQLPFSTFKEAMDMSPGLISYRVCHNFLDPLTAVVNYVSQGFSWGPRADGTFLEAPLQHLVLQGNVAHIPFVTGNETTCFHCSSLWLIRSLQEIAMTKELCLA